MSESGTGLLTLKVEFDGENAGPEARDAASELLRDLRKYLPAVLPETNPAETDKGPAQDLLAIGISLASSGAITEMIKLVQDWVKRLPARRSVAVQGSDGKEVWRVTGENVDDATMVAALTVAAKTPAH
jgi:Effector Associated Constant Component 1